MQKWTISVITTPGSKGSKSFEIPEMAQGLSQKLLDKKNL